MLETRLFGRDAENQAMEGNKSVVQCLIQVTCQPVVLCSRLQGHLSWPPVCHPWTLDFGIHAEMTGLLHFERWIEGTRKDGYKLRAGLFKAVRGES